MGLSVGGLSILAAYTSSGNNGQHHGFLRPPDVLLASHNFKSVLMLLAVVLAICLLAYLTNPSEASFRKFLTELAFRHHLTRLTSGAGGSDDGPSSTPPSSTLPSPNSPFPLPSTSAQENGPHRSLSTKKSFELLNQAHHYGLNQRFQFSSRASVSLRTPPHVFRSFWIFTIAVVSPVTGAESAIAGSWFIGAFGSWWMGGRVVQRSRGMLSLRSRKGEEVGVVPSRVGLVGFRSLDEEDGYEGYKLIADPFHNPHNLTPPRGLRNRSSSRSGAPPHHGPPNGTAHPSHGQRQQQQRDASVPPLQPAVPARSTTPPPLPVSASLPLHTKGCIPEHHLPIVDIHNALNNCSTDSLPLSPTSKQTPSGLTTHQQQQQHRPVSRQPSTTSLLESSPIISELMTQLSTSQNSVNELRNQLSAFEASATSARSGLEAEVEVQRAKKRSEDTARFELRARIKTLEDEKRRAEAVKRKEDKKVRDVHSKREEVERRLERLRGEMVKMRKKSEESDEAVLKSSAEVKEVETEMGEKIDDQKREIEVCERVLGALNERLRDLEGLIEEERRGVECAKEKAGRRMEAKERLLREFMTATNGMPPANTWPPSVARTSSSGVVPPPTAPPVMPDVHSSPSRAPLPIVAEPVDHPASPTRPRPLSLGSLGNRPSPPQQHAHVQQRQQDTILPPPPASFHSRFSPFDVESPTHSSTTGSTNATSPMGGSLNLIPSGIMESPRSVDDVSNPINGTGGENGYFLTPPVLPVGAASPPLIPALENRFDAQRATIRSLVNGPLTPLFNTVPTPPEDDANDRAETGSVRSRRWFSRDHREEKEPESHAVGGGWFNTGASANSTDPTVNTGEKLVAPPKKGLNPDAKSFKFTRRSSFLNLRSSATAPETEVQQQHQLVIDPLNPSGPAPLPPTTPRSTFFSSLRAFQPSPAEREVLRLAMEASNGSLERINSRGSRGSGGGGSSPTSAMRNPFAMGPIRTDMIVHPHLDSARHAWNNTTTTEGNSGVISLDSPTPDVVPPPPSQPQQHKKGFSPFNSWGRHDKLLGSGGEGSGSK